MEIALEIKEAEEQLRQAMLASDVEALDGSVRFFVCGPVAACCQAGPDFHHVGLMNRSPYRIAN